jgi:hypothetical protein
VAERDRDELVVIHIGMTRREHVGLVNLMKLRGEVSMPELVRSLILQALLEESVEEVKRRKASSEPRGQGTHDDDPMFWE